MRDARYGEHTGDTLKAFYVRGKVFEKTPESRLPGIKPLGGPPSLRVDVHSGERASTAAYVPPSLLSPLSFKEEGLRSSYKSLLRYVLTSTISNDMLAYTETS